MSAGTTQFNAEAEHLGREVERLRTVNEALVKALEECLGQAEGCWINHYGDNPEGGSVPHHIEHARAALKLARGEEGLRVVPGWQPIETAPKERVSILVTGGTFTWIDGSLSDCDWPLEFVAQAAWRKGHWSLGHNKHGDECIAEPKWWQPMPEPPTTDAALSLAKGEG